jgi:uncharacterized protein YjbJ (UPF0337 family)
MTNSNEDIPMDANQVAGTAKNLTGKVEEGVGRVAGDVKTEVQGKVDQALGATQDLYGQARETAGQAVDAVENKAKETAAAVRQQAAGFEQQLRSSVDARPLTTIAVALGIGWMLGRMFRA